MSITNTNAVAKFAAVVAGLGLVAMSFASFAIPAKAQTVTFTRDLTVGSTGADVTSLQTWLIGKGFSIPAGATGYFGAQTKAALAAYQAANGITPAAGYFGPITRAKVNAGGGTTTGGGTSTGDLKGGETDLNNFDLKSGDGTGDEGEEGVEIAVAKFDVDDADARIERLELTASSTDNSVDERPWKYFDTITVMMDGKKVGDVDASDRDNWDEGDDSVYTISLTGLDAVVKEGDNAELSIEADISDSIDDNDQDQEFDLSIMDEGIRAVDSEGIQNYIGDDNDTVSFGFGAQDNGDLTVRDSNDNPDASVLKVDDSSTSDPFDVFTFEIRNSNDADALVTKMVIGTTLTGSTSTADVIRKATLTVDGDEYDGDIEDANDGDITFDDMDTTVAGNDTVTATLTVEFTGQENHYNVGDIISFSVDSADMDAEGVDSGDDLTGSDLSGSTSSENFTLSTTGFMVSANDTDSSTTASGTNADAFGTFHIIFDVKADEDDPVYLAKTAASSTSSTAGAVYRIIKDGSVYTGMFDSKSAQLTSTADTSGGAFKVNAGDTETFTLTVNLDPLTSTGTGQYAIELYQVHYGPSSGSTSASTYSVDTDDADFETDPTYVTAD